MKKADFLKTLNYLRRNGFRKTLTAVNERLKSHYGEDYQYVLPSESELASQRETCVLTKDPRKISILVPAYETAAAYLRELLDSVLSQSYPYWELLLADGISDGLVLDLGCGTGTMTELLAGRGYDMIGVDGSADMLMSAQEKKIASGHDILYLLQDLSEFELYGTVRAIVSVCDCLNYLTDEEELARAFALAANYLDPGGVLIFDMNTEYKYREIIGNRTIAESREDASFIWENEYDEETRLNEYLLTLFLQREDQLYERFQELHVQKAYSLTEIEDLLQRAGLKTEAVWDDYTLRPPKETTQRWTIVARKDR